MRPVPSARGQRQCQPRSSLTRDTRELVSCFIWIDVIYPVFDTAKGRQSLLHELLESFGRRVWLSDDKCLDSRSEGGLMSEWAPAVNLP